jgi:MoaA/NifB/PqqE/SkfB family radical SAM enzyme
VFQIQLEGGEPTVHPKFWDFVEFAKDHSRCERLVICTNGVLLPRKVEELKEWIEQLGESFTVKLSVNHYLLERDAGLIALAQELREIIDQTGNGAEFVVNVRLRKGGRYQDDRQIAQQIESAGLNPVSNIFFLQRYGFAAGEQEWDEPFLVGENFRMINPDGQVFGPDLKARSEGMRRLLG